MEPGASKQDDGVVNMTRAMEALSPWLNQPRKTIIQVEALVLAAAALLLLQLILGSCRRRWHNSFIKYGLQVCNGSIFPLIVYTLGMMQSSPIKNSLYPVWAAFLIMASAGTTAVQQYDFYDSFYKKLIQVVLEYVRYGFYVNVFLLLLNPNAKTLWVTKSLKDTRLPRTSSYCVSTLVVLVLLTKTFESFWLVKFGYKKNKKTIFIEKKKTHRVCTNGRRRMQESNQDTTEKIRNLWGNSAAGEALKDLCQSYALFRQLLEWRYFGEVCFCLNNSHHIPSGFFVFEKLLPSEGDFKRTFRIIELELGFFHDFFFTKYYYTFRSWMYSPVPLFQSLFLLKIILLLAVGVMAIRKSLVLETPNPIIEVHISKADYTITLLVLSIALLVELVQVAFYLASNWAQVSLVMMHVRKRWGENAYIFGKIIGLPRWVMISQQLRNKIGQHSVIFGAKQQPDPVEISDAMKKSIARSLRWTYANNLTTDEEISVRLQNQMLGEYSWALSNLSQLEVILIWHIATEYCDAISDDPSNGNGTTPNSNGRGVAVHLSRYCVYLIGSVPELVPYHEADIAELAQEVMEEREELFSASSRDIPEVYNAMNRLPGTEEKDDPTTMFKKGVKLGKQLKRNPDRWEVLQHFWAKKIIQAAASHYTTKEHMQHLEDGGEFLTHIWALLAHAGILNLKRGKDQDGQANLESGPSAAP